AGMSGTAPPGVGKRLESISHTPGDTAETASHGAGKVPKTKAISRDLHRRIQAEYDRGTPKSEVCGRLHIGNDYYPTIRVMYQQFDLARQRRSGAADVPPRESEEG